MKEKIYKRFQEIFGAEGEIGVYFAPGRDESDRMSIPIITADMYFHAP